MRKLISIFVILLVLSMSVVSALSYTYDGNGNRISGDGFYRVYDSSNHLVNVYTGDSPVIANLVENFTWDYAEERVFIKDTYFNRTLNESIFYWKENFITVQNISGSFDFYYVIQDGEIVAMEDYAGHKFYYHNDHKGSVQLVTNENGSAIERTFYEPFGAITSGGSKTRFDYEGEEFDSVTGDYDFDARRVDPLNSQFIQPDSVIQNVYDPQSLNHYAFERNNPYKYEDENGHIWRLAALGGAFIAGFFYGESKYQHNLRAQGYSSLSTQQLFDSQNAGLEAGKNFVANAALGLASHWVFAKFGSSLLTLSSGLTLDTLMNVELVGDNSNLVVSSDNINSCQINEASSTSNQQQTINLDTNLQSTQESSENSDSHSTAINTLKSYFKGVFSFIRGGKNAKKD